MDRKAPAALAIALKSTHQRQSARTPHGQNATIAVDKMTEAAGG
jgi:hypothetical protein